MEHIIIDTIILIKAFAGDRNAGSIFEGNITYISFITQIELLSGKNKTNKQYQIIQEALSQFIIHPYSLPLQEKVIKIRRTTGLKSLMHLLQPPQLNYGLHYSPGTIYFQKCMA